jgi:hypothetical protein
LSLSPVVKRNGEGGLGSEWSRSKRSAHVSDVSWFAHHVRY